MKTRLFKQLVVTAMFLIIACPIFTMALPAQADELDPWGDKQDEIQEITGLGENDPREIAAGVINVIMGFLGIVAVVIILIGGFKWMTASGNEDKVQEAKNLIIAGIIGLVIILAAFAIAKFVLEQLLSATGAN
jgi:heme/copper-type cytochrome/quinol oxidase subunit 2